MSPPMNISPEKVSVTTLPAFAAEVEIQAACMEDPNFREAYEAFKAKRPPEFDRE